MSLRQSSLLFIVALACSIGLFSTAQASNLLPVVEEDGDSDLAFNAAVSGSYTSGTLDLSFSGTGSALDIGPGTAADHLAFGASLTTSGIQIDSSGSVVSGGTITVNYLGPPNPPGSTLLTAYPILASNPLMLTGTVRSVLLEGAAGDDNLHIAFEATGGALFGDFTDATSRFVGLIINAASGGGLPSSFAGDFSFGGSSTIDMIGPIVPEPASVLLLIGGFGALLTRRSVR